MRKNQTQPSRYAASGTHGAIDSRHTPNIASVLKSVIARVARKEIRAELESLKKANSEHRSAIAKLRRELAALQKQLKQAGRERTASAKEKTMAERKHRFSAARLARPPH